MTVTETWFDGLDYEKQKSVLRRAIKALDKRQAWKDSEVELYYNEVTDLRHMNAELYWVDIPSDLQEVINSWE